MKFSNSKSLASLLAMLTATSPMAYGVNAANPSSAHGEVDTEEAEETEVDEADAESEETDAEENDANEEESEGTAEEPAEDDNDAENDDSKNTDEEKDAEKADSENADTEEDNEQEIDKSSSHVPAKVAGAGALFTTLIFGVKRLFSTNKKSNSEEPNKPKDQNLDQDKKKVEDEDDQKDKEKEPKSDEMKKPETALLEPNFDSNSLVRIVKLFCCFNKGNQTVGEYCKCRSKSSECSYRDSFPYVYGIGYKGSGESYDHEKIREMLSGHEVAGEKIYNTFLFGKCGNFMSLQISDAAIKESSDEDLARGCCLVLENCTKLTYSSYSTQYNQLQKGLFTWDSCVVLIVTCDILNEVFKKRTDFNAPTIKNKLNELNNLRKELGLEKYYAKSIDKDGKIEIAEG